MYSFSRSLLLITALLFLLGSQPFLLVQVEKTADTSFSDPRQTGGSVAKLNQSSCLAPQHKIQYPDGRQLLSAGNNNGTIIVFFHVPKTGGTSVQTNFCKTKGVQYLFSLGRKKYDVHASMVRTWAFNGIRSSDKNQIKFLEVHAGDCPSFMDIRPQIQRWRNQSSSLGINFFAFTIMRNPLAWSVSAYNDVCIKRQKCQPGPLKPSKESFVKYQANNTQCRFFFHGWRGWPGGGSKFSPTLEECNTVFDEMKAHLDWVGSLECLEDTLQVLRNVVPNFNISAYSTENAGNKMKGIRTELLSNSSVQYIQNISEMDSQLYTRAKMHFNSIASSHSSMLSHGSN